MSRLRSSLVAKIVIALVLVPALLVFGDTRTVGGFLRLSGGTVTGPILLPDGTAAAPSLGFSSDADGTGTGIYRHGANVLGFSTNGAGQWSLSAIDLSPITDNADDIGTTARRVKHIYTGRIVTGAATPTVTGTGAGTTGTYTLSTGSSDLGGTIAITAGGASIAALGTITLTFSVTNGAFGTNTPSVVAMLRNSSGTWNTRATVIGSGDSTTQFDLKWDNNAVALTTGQVYVITYHVIGK